VVLGLRFAFRKYFAILTSYEAQAIIPKINFGDATTKAGFWSLTDCKEASDWEAFKTSNTIHVGQLKKKHRDRTESP
jgi:hypothetical protein